MQMTRKMSLQIYKQMKRQNPFMKKNLINSPVMRNSSKGPITLMNQMMTLTQKVKKKRGRCLMKIRETDKWKSKEMMKMRKRNEMIRTKRKRKTMREKTQKAYVKSIIPLDHDNDDEINPLATLSPKGNIQLCFIFLSNIMLASIKYNLLYFCKFQLFANYY